MDGKRVGVGATDNGLGGGGGEAGRGEKLLLRAGAWEGGTAPHPGDCGGTSRSLWEGGGEAGARWNRQGRGMMCDGAAATAGGWRLDVLQFPPALAVAPVGRRAAELQRPPTL